MTTCEESTYSMCSKFQSANCFHCHLSNELKLMQQQIRDESEKRREIFNQIVSSFEQWRVEQIEQIDRIYHEHLQTIESQRENLIQAEQNLLEHVINEEHFDMNAIHSIQKLNRQIREENKYLERKLTKTMPPTIDEQKWSSNDLQRGRGLKRLIQLFANIESIERAKKAIVLYLKKRGDQFELPVVICSYLIAWNRKTKIYEKAFLLNEHITTIEKYLKKSQMPADVLLGIQAFFYNETIEVDKSEMMTFLLQFFLDHRCIDRNQIFDWFSRDIHGYKGFSLAKQLATPFVRSLSTPSQTDQIEIKQEPMAIA